MKKTSGKIRKNLFFSFFIKKIEYNIFETFVKP